MNEETLRASMESLGNALDRLAEALAIPEAEALAIDGTIQRFEFTFELFWKLIQRLLTGESVEARSPKTPSATDLTARLARRGATMKVLTDRAPWSEPDLDGFR